MFSSRCSLIFIFILLSSNVFAGEQKNTLRAHYDQATYIESLSGDFKMKAEIRLQFRASSPFDDNPTSVAELDQLNSADLALNRSRLKFEGIAYRPELHYKVEYDFNNATLLDGRLTYRLNEKVAVRLGRYKVNFNPERVRSSKDLQVVERSVVNQYFTFDRQQGFSFLGRLGKDTAFDSNYSLGVYSGDGREASNSDENFLTVARYQWNALGGKIETSMGDLKFRQQPALNVAVSAAHNISPYTAFSSSGGEQLPGYPAGINGEYEVQQWMLDLSYKFNGFSFVTEYHEKEISDEQVNTTNKLSGMLINAGFFPHVVFATLPSNLELAVRLASVDASELADNKMDEYTLAANWFFSGHRNKITFDAGSYTVDEHSNNQSDSTTQLRYRLQWDISF